MRIGVISDTHQMSMAITAALSAAGKVDAWLHVGDGAREFVRMQEQIGVPIYAVSGNCDVFSELPKKLIIELGGKRIFIAHGHEYAVNFSTQMLSEEAEKEKCDIAVYGHTHLPDIQYGRVYILNPGSAAIPHGGFKPSCGIITIENREIRLEIIDI